MLRLMTRSRCLSLSTVGGAGQRFEFELLAGLVAVAAVDDLAVLVQEDGLDLAVRPHVLDQFGEGLRLHHRQEVGQGVGL